MPYDPLQLQTDIDFITSQPEWQDEASRRDYIRKVGVEAKSSLDNESHTELMNTLWGKLDQRGTARKAVEFGGRALGEIVKSIPATIGAVGTAISDVSGLSDTGSAARLKAGGLGLIDTAGQRVKQLAPNDRQEQRDALLESLREDIDKGAVPTGFESWLSGEYDNRDIDDPETGQYVGAILSGISRASVAADKMGDIEAKDLIAFQNSDRYPGRADSDIEGDMGPRQLLADYVATRDPSSWERFKERVTETEAQYNNRLSVATAQKPQVEKALAKMPEGLEKEMVQRSLSMQESPIDLATAVLPVFRGAKALQAAKAGGMAAAAGRLVKGPLVEGVQEGLTEALQDPRSTTGQIAEAAALGTVGSALLESGSAGIGAAARKIGELRTPAAAAETPATAETPASAEAAAPAVGSAEVTPEEPLPTAFVNLDNAVKAAVEADTGEVDEIKVDENVLPVTAAVLKEVTPEAPPSVAEVKIEETTPAPAVVSQTPPTSEQQTELSVEGETQTAAPKQPVSTEPPIAEAPVVTGAAEEVDAPTQEALQAVAGNSATPEQIQSLVSKGLARTVDGNPVLTEQGLAAMPEGKRPPLTEQERVAEITSQTLPPTETAPQTTTPKPQDASIQNEVQEAGGPTPVQGQPPQTRPEGQAQEGAAQRSREGEEGQQVLTPKVDPNTPEFGSTNTVFTKEKAEEARKVLRRKLGQSNGPIFDPELFSAATNYAGYLIEGGVRSIADFSANMVKEFGEGIRPYIKGLYNGVRDIAEFEGMDDASKVNEVLGEATPAAPQKPAARPQPDLAAPAPAPETPVSAPEVIGIANARIDESRKVLGLPPIERPVQEVYGDKALWDDAGAAMEADSGRASYLVASLIKNPRPATTLETAILLREQVARMDALQRASIELVNATPENQEAARQKYDYAVMAKTEADEAAALAGAEQGRAFRARQLLSALDYSLANMTTTLQGASQRKLTDAEVAEVVAESEKINAALKAVNDLKESSGSVAEEESIFAEVVKEAKAEARLTAKDTVTEAKAEIKSGKSLMDVLNEKRDAARLRIRKRGGNLNVNLNPADLVDYAIIAASYIAEGAVTLKDVTVKMVKDFGAAIEQHMPKIFSEAQVLKSELDKAVVEEPLEGETKAKGKKPALEQLKESGEVSGRLIHDLVKEKVKSGLTTLDDVFKAVTKDVQTVIPEITERELRDMFSGYGKVKFPSQEELPKKVRELRRLAQLASAIEDAQKKIAPLRSGPQRDEASLVVREAQKELHRIMKEQGIERAPGPRALKSALDAAKTRLRNQIEELEKQVAERKRTPASKRDITYDAETNSLIEKRDALKKTLDEVDPVLPPTPQELIKNALKELDKTIAELERRVKERDVSEKPKTETPLTEQLQVKRDQRDALRKQLNDIRVEIEGEPYLTQEEINERAERRLVSEINEIERQIAEKDFTPEQARKPENTAALIRLKARRDVLREQFNALKEQTIGKKVKSEAERVEIAVKALEKSIDDLNARIAKGDVMPRPKADNVPKTPEILELRKERDGLRKTLQQMRKAQEEAAKDPVEEQIKRDRKYLETQIKNYEKKLASGDFRPRPKKAKEYDAKLAAETLKLRKLKEAWAEKVFTAQLNSRGPAAKAYDFGKQVLHTARAVLTSFDVSAVFRQGGFITLGNPVRAFQNLRPMFESLASEKAAEKTKNELEARPNFKLYQQSKLYLADFSQNNMNQQEENFMSRWLNKIPSYLLGGVIRGSQRAYVTFLNRLRADTFDAMLGSLQKGPTPTTEEIKAIADYINIATGRGDLGKFQQAGEALNTVFFAPRLVMSRFQILGGYPAFKASGRTKNLVLREYAKFLTGAALVYALGMAFQDDDDEPLELDPRSSDFLKLRYGDTRVDPLGGLIQASVFLSRVVSGEKKQFSGKIVPLRDSYRLMNLFRENPRKDKVRYGADNTFDVGANFLRSKFSPSFGAAVDLITGETVIGEKTTPTEIGYKMIMPLTFGETQKTLEAQGMSKGSALTIVSLFGMGVQTYD